MSDDRLTSYREAAGPLPSQNRLWPLYGAGLENLGADGQPIDVPMPQAGADELLVRHDACGLCFSDIKVIRLGEDHPRIYRDMQRDPVTLGHEVSMTVAGVGENLREEYSVGDRFVIQADIFVDGVGYAYGYEIQGGLSLYGVLDWRVLDGDDGNYLLPVQPETGYAESALTEPWACVIAAYELQYRTGLKAGGTTWIIRTSAALGTGTSAALGTGTSAALGTSTPAALGTGPVAEPAYTISAGYDQESHPARLMLTEVPAAFAAWLKERAAALGIEVVEVAELDAPLFTPVDDIVLLGADASIVETVSPHLADHGIFALVADEPLPRRVAVDIGRVHYNRWVYVGGVGPDIAQVYHLPVRSSLKPGGRAWFVGAGGPMGRMHVQRAIQSHDGPGTIVCTDVSDARLGDLCESFAAEAEAQGIAWACLNPLNKEEYEAGMAALGEQGFDDIIVLAPVPAVIADAANYLALKGVMNVFAGVARGTMVDLELSEAYLKDTRVIGHSASSIDDLRLMLGQAESGELSPNRSVAAIGSLSAARDGLQAVLDTAFPGKVVIFPQIKEMPLTALPDLKDSLPTVYTKLRDGREWTVEAEEEFLRLMLV